LPPMPEIFAKEFKRGDFWFDYEVEL